MQLSGWSFLTKGKKMNKKITFILSASLLAGSALAADYSFWVKVPKRITSDKTRAFLSELSSVGQLPCFVNADVNASGFTWGILKFKLNGFYTSTISGLLPSIQLSKFTKDAFRQTKIANFKSPVGTIPGDASGHVAEIQSGKALREIHFLVSAGQPAAPASDTLYVSLDGRAAQSFSLDPKVANKISVSDGLSFTSVAIWSSGMTDAFMADNFGYVLAQ